MSGSIGDNVFRASGVIAAAAAGRTGAVDWQTDSIKTATFTATTTEGYFCNTNGGVFTVNLPAGVAGSIVAISDYTRTFNTNNLTVSPNGSEKIGGVAADATLDVDGQSATFVYVDSTEGWINVQETESSQTGLPPFVGATGGTITCSGDYQIHTFTGPGTFCVSRVSPDTPENVVSYMVIAGGGSGGGSTPNGGGGGGAGGFREYKNSCDPYTASPLNGNPCGTAITVSASPYAITVGGGAPTAPADGTQGSNSVFSTITSTGGGGGGKTTAPGPSPGLAGGSGGGGGSGTGPGRPGGAGNTPPTTPAQGFVGGVGGSLPSPDKGAGGGGGATVEGTSGAPPTSGPGGAGATSSINATPTARAGGGGGGGHNCAAPAAGSGGAGGGGAGGAGGGTNPGTTGGPNTGGGGGGGSCTGIGGAGGPGTVIIRYKYQ